MIGSLYENAIDDIKLKIRRLKHIKVLQVQENISKDFLEIKIYKRKKIVYHDISENTIEFPDLYERFIEFYLTIVKK